VVEYYDTGIIMRRSSSSSMVVVVVVVVVIALFVTMPPSVAQPTIEACSVDEWDNSSDTGLVLREGRRVKVTGKLLKIGEHGVGGCLGPAV